MKRNFDLKLSKVLKRIVFLLAYLFLGLFFLVLFFEAIYRLQLIDFYSPELKFYNSISALRQTDNRKTILIMGDSCSAGRNSYPKLLQKLLPQYRVINAAIPGSGILEALMIAPRRLRQFKPAICIYQIYTGNDLFDLNYPINWGKVSRLRNIYWTLANHFKFLSFFNYRLSQERFYLQSLLTGLVPQDLDSDTVDAVGINLNNTFSVEEYSPRFKIHLLADPGMLDEQILVKSKRSIDFTVYVKKLENLIALFQHNGSRVYIIVIPHCCQVDKSYYQNMRLLGAALSEPEEIMANNYPFYAKIFDRFRGYSQVAVLNPIQALKSMERQNEPVYYQNDEHLNSIGQRVIGKYLFKQLSYDFKQPFLFKIHQLPGSN